MTDGTAATLANAVDRLAAEAAEILPPGGATERARRTGSDADLAALARTTRSLASRLAMVVAGGGSRSDRQRNAELLDRAEVLDRRVATATREAAIARRDRFEHGLLELRSCSGMAELMERLAPIMRDACDAERVSVGIVDDGAWTPIREADRRSGDGPAVSYGPPTALADLSAERAAFTTRRPIVLEAAEAADGHPGRPACVIAPTFVGGRARGLFRAEFRWAVPTPEDTVAVERMGRALGHAFEMLEMHERLLSVDRTVDRLRETVGARAPGDEPAGGDGAFGVPDGAAPARGGAGPGADDGRAEGLTPRQRQTLELMLLGLSNAQIAERLVVGVPTVKSHVSAILRAVGAVNRAEAIGRYLERDEG